MGGEEGYFGTLFKAKVVSLSQISPPQKSNFHGKLSIFKSFGEALAGRNMQCKMHSTQCVVPWQNMQGKASVLQVQ